MCLFVKKEEFKRLISKTNLRCYKYLDSYGKKLYSPIQHYLYEIDKCQPAVNIIERESNTPYNRNCFLIFEGYHSSKKLSDRYKYLCIIPKGSEYIIGESEPGYGEIQFASNTIICLDSIYNPFTWFKYFFKYR